MGKTFDIERFRQDAEYVGKVEEWVYEGNLSYFDQSQWIHEWFGEPSFLLLGYGVDSGNVESLCHFQTSLLKATRALYDILDEARDCDDLWTCDVVKSIIAEIDEELDIADEFLWED